MTQPHATKTFLISAIASGQGKTTITAALARKLRNEGQRVRIFKAGPDFLDPMMLERASGAPVHNLDLWMVGMAECRKLLAEAAREADVILIEGVMGLYDGTPSSADLAKALGIPVIGTEVGGIPEALSHGGGVTIPAGDSSALAAEVQRIAGDADLLKSMSRNASNAALNFDLPGMVERTLAVYRSVMERIERQ